MQPRKALLEEHDNLEKYVCWYGAINKELAQHNKFSATGIDTICDNSGPHDQSYF